MIENKNFDDIRIGVRAANVFRDEKINTINELLELNPEEVSKFFNMGKKATEDTIFAITLNLLGTRWMLYLVRAVLEKAKQNF